MTTADLQDTSAGYAPDLPPAALEEDALHADGAARPRKRRPLAAAPAPSEDGLGNGEQTNPTPPGDDLPRWHHHSLVDP
ncbi:MAG: hypothetical protein ACKOOH_04660, partial [Cyanobium sp.]